MKLETITGNITFGKLISIVIFSALVYFLNSQLTSINTKIEKLNSLINNNQVDTLYVNIPDSNTTVTIDDNKIMNELKKYMENLHVSVNNNILDTVESSVVLTDTVYTSFTDYVRSQQPTWGTTMFSDSSNILTNIQVRVDWPYGERSVTYYNKYQIRPWSFGIGKLNNEPAIMGSFYYKRLGISGVLNYDENQKKLGTGYFIHFRF